jgi:hypothetical protein
LASRGGNSSSISPSSSTILNSKSFTVELLKKWMRIIEYFSLIFNFDKIWIELIRRFYFNGGTFFSSKYLQQMSPIKSETRAVEQTFISMVLVESGPLHMVSTILNCLYWFLVNGCNILTRHKQQCPIILKNGQIRNYYYYQSFMFSINRERILNVFSISNKFTQWWMFRL